MYSDLPAEYLYLMEYLATSANYQAGYDYRWSSTVRARRFFDNVAGV